MGRPPLVQIKRWKPPKAPKLAGPYARNDALAAAMSWGTPGVGPEDVAVDAGGRPITGLADGRIIRFAADGSAWEELANVGGRPLGIELFDDGRILICNADLGLQRLDPDTGEVEVLLDSVAGERLRITNNAAILPDQTVLFTSSTRHYDLEYYRGDIFSNTCSGRLFLFDPETGDLETRMDGLQFANGVAVSPDTTWCAVAETSHYRINRHWLSGKKAGQSEVLIDNLPGFPDNLSTGASGTIWVALVTPRVKAADLLARMPAGPRKAVWATPEALQPKPAHVGFVLGLDVDGKVVANLQDPSGEHVFMVTGVREHGDALWLGSLTDQAIHRVPLPAHLTAA